MPQSRLIPHNPDVSFNRSTFDLHPNSLVETSAKAELPLPAHFPLPLFSLPSGPAWTGKVSQWPPQRRAQEFSSKREFPALRCVPALLIFAASVTAAHSEVGVFDWEASDSCQAVHYHKGLEVTNIRGTLCPNISNNPYNGTVSSNDCKGISFVHIAGIPFTPLSIDLAEYSAVVKNTSLTFTGRTEAGETVSVTFTIDGLCDGPGGIEDFQTFTFPAEFADLTELTGPNIAFSCDNLVFDTVIPPPLPAVSQVPAGFSSMTTIHSRHVHDNHFIVGPDFSYATGFRAPGTAKFLTGNSPLLFIAASPWVDPASQALFYGAPSSLWRRTPTTTEQIVTLEEVTGAGFPATSINRPRPYSDGHLFISYDFNHAGGEAFQILEKTSGGMIIEKVGPATALPIGSSTSNPYFFPDFITASGDSFAFHTSLVGSTTTDRIFASFDGEPIVLLASEGVWIDSADSELGKLVKIIALDFNPGGALELTAQTTTGEFLFTYAGAAGLSESQRLGITRIAPVNTGKQASGTIIRTAHGMEFLKSPWTSEIYRKSGGQWFRVIGPGDRIGDRTIAYLDFLACPTELPLRLIVDVRFADESSVSHNMELELSTPVELQPRIIGVVRDPSGYLFFGLDRLTYGRTYILKESADLVNWQPLVPVEVMPVQNLAIAPNSARSRFFRVEEQSVELDAP